MHCSPYYVMGYLESLDRLTTFLRVAAFKDVLFRQCLRSTLATLPAPQIQHALLTLRA